MAKASFVQDGSVINYKNTTEQVIAYNEVVMLTDCLGVAVAEILPGGTGALKISGVFLIPAAQVAITAGQALYWDTANSQVTSVSDDNKKVGIAAEPKEASAGVCLVKLGG